MPRERTVEAFILKRTDFGESDQIITLFTKEEGKIRTLVKAAKMPTSKLQPLLQPLFQTRINLSGQRDGGLGKVIGVQLIQAYSGVLESEAKLSAWYVVSEILIKALADSAPNEALFAEFQNYASFLHSTDATLEQIKDSVAQFQIKALAALGLGIHTVEDNPGSLWFSLDRGGFVTDDSLDAIPVKPDLYQKFRTLARENYDSVENSSSDNQLSALISRFVTHQLEREIKSQKTLVYLK